MYALFRTQKCNCRCGCRLPNSFMWNVSPKNDVTLSVSPRGKLKIADYIRRIKLKNCETRHYNDNTCTYRSERNLGSSSSKRRNCFFIQYAFAIRLDKERKTRANVEFGFAFICIYLNEFNNIFLKFLVSWMIFVIQYCVQNLNIGYRNKWDRAHCCSKFHFLMTSVIDMQHAYTTRTMAWATHHWECSLKFRFRDYCIWDFVYRAILTDNTLPQ